MLVLMCLFTFSAFPTFTVGQGSPPLWVYDSGLKWQDNWGWLMVVDMADTTGVPTGTVDMKCTITPPWAAIMPVSSPMVDASLYTHLSFDMKPTKVGQTLIGWLVIKSLSLNATHKESNKEVLDPYVLGGSKPTPNKWFTYEVPLSLFTGQLGSSFDGFAIQDSLNVAGNIMFFQRILFIDKRAATTAAATSASTTSSPAASGSPSWLFAVVGGVGGALLLIAAIVVIVVFMIRRRRAQSAAGSMYSPLLDHQGHQALNYQDYGESQTSTMNLAPVAEYKTTTTEPTSHM
jgi:hypothetical protein